ncbi:NACHT domain-containing protein [Actinomadura sp. NPDC047616]|uniref:NACHT domain-containing protein n=1 Tax=Actinomadura sp. NPDC047616 TaxID=3155914 RepID=UPI0033F66732
MSVEGVALGVGRSVVQLAVGRLVAGRADRKAQGQDLVDLIRLGFPDEIRRRRARRQFEEIADSVGERLMTYCRQEFGGLTDGDREAVLHQVVLTLERADLSDEALLSVDADPVRLARALRATLPARQAGFQLGEAGARLYEVVLDECCDCLARIIVHLPQFGPRASAETLARLSGLADQVTAVLARLPARSLVAPEGESDDEEFTRRYLASISESLDTLELFGVRFERFSRPQTKLSIAYISLNVLREDNADRRKADHGAVPVSEWRIDDREAGAVRVESALGEHRLMLVRGEAGGGKSTLLRWLAVTAARGEFSGDLASWNGCVPFLIKLRSYSGARLPRPEEFVDGVAGHLAGLMPRGWVHRRLLSGRALLLVDGVDEVTANQRHDVRQWLRDLVGQFPGVRVVVTSRPAAAGSAWLRAEGFATAFMEPLGPADLRALIEHWHDAVRHCADLPCEPERLPGYEARLLARLEAAPHLRTLGSSPLLAAMLCALNLDRETLPRDRMGLYAAALDLLLETRDAKRGIPSAQTIDLERDQKIRILQELAWHLSTSGRVELPKPMVERVIAERLRTMPRVRAQAADVLDLLLQRSGVLREPVPGRIDFVHRTVQEYLTAKQAADLGDMDLLIRNAHRDQWRETVIMAAGHANEPLRRELIGGILERVEAEPRRARFLKLLAVSCLETLPSVPDDLRAALDRCIDALVPPRNLAAARSLATAGEPVLARLPETLDGLSEASARATVRAAALINGPEALDVLARYATDQRTRVQVELNESWDYFDVAEYAERVLAHMPPGGELYRVNSARRLATLGIIAPLAQLYVNVEEVPDFGFLDGHAHSLRTLNLWFRRPGTDLSRLSELPALRDLTLTSPGLPDLRFLSAMPPLERIWLGKCSEIDDFSPLERHTDLRELSLAGGRRLTTLEVLPPLDKVVALGLNGTGLTKGLSEVATTAPHVRSLYVGECSWVNDLAELDGLPLRHLSLYRCTEVKDLSPLSAFTTLDRLDLEGTNVHDLSPLAGLTNLSVLWLEHCHKVTDLTPLASLPNLSRLHIKGIAPGTDLSPLAGNRKLTVYITPGQDVRGAKALGRRLKTL